MDSYSQSRIGRLGTRARQVMPEAAAKAVNVKPVIWLEIQAWQRLKPKTLECSRDYLQHLLDFFGDKPINAIDAA